ncbi:peptidoglycan-binding protein [Kitasatospora sp. NPDC056446]|uniref:peptidoglycan-binding domain-containing protein n=1 Tax=Kitasatospora sp. NPDC056446 TaxID=3345819 RepID=UPI0036B4F470
MTTVIGLGGTAQADHMAPTLRYGSSGFGVECVQVMLNRVGLGHTIAVDGKFGKDTKGMVEDFQRARGHLDIDGVVGRETGGALWELTYQGWFTNCYDFIPTP